MQPRQVEVVRVAGPGVFVDEACHGRGGASAGRFLENGYYVALGPARKGRQGDEGKSSFHGPLATEAQARLLAVSARALGLA
jgi:hypothetical protein